MGELTVGEVLCEVLPRLRGLRTRGMPAWPPDVFGLMSTLVQRAGLYGAVLGDWPPVEAYAEDCLIASVAWRDAVDRGRGAPRVVKELWREVLGEWDTPIRELDGRQGRNAILRLMAIADECGAGLGGAFATKDFDEYISRAAILLEEGSLCEEIDASRLRVLPKRRTPPSGLNVRSLSLHLACTHGCEVTPRWVPLGSLDESPETINVMVIPYPYEVDPLWIRAVEGRADEQRNMDPSRFGLFTSDRPADPVRVGNLVKAAIETGRKRVGQIHLILFPELALTWEEHAAAWRVAEENGVILMAGVGEGAHSGGGPGENVVSISDPSFWTGKYRQRKHHRWRLERSQIGTYELGATLNPARDWWEYISIADREQHFLQMAKWLLIAPLICEDLARPDPAGDVVRAVGPDLVIAFLMDGPQLSNRWPARYATVLAEDPGCSVLTITSLGMAMRSQPPSGMSVSRKVASWKDPIGGLKEIEVSRDRDVAVVLTLNRDTRRNEGHRQVSADGRENGVSTGFPILSRVQCLEL